MSGDLDCGWSPYEKAMFTALIKFQPVDEGLDMSGSDRAFIIEAGGRHHHSKDKHNRLREIFETYYHLLDDPPKVQIRKDCRPPQKAR